MVLVAGREAAVFIFIELTAAPPLTISTETQLLKVVALSLAWLKLVLSIFTEIPKLRRLVSNMKNVPQTIDNVKDRFEKG